MAQQPRSKQRDPPPTLFLHPSPAASHVSLPGLLGSGPPASTGSNTVSGTTVQPSSSLHRTTSLLNPLDTGAITSPAEGQGRRGSHAARSIRGATGIGLSGLPVPLRAAESSRATDRTDALWAEMQATLEEVELSASGGTRVFGPDHDRKLTELRAAQIRLAQAWARSEADEAIETIGTGTAASSAGVPGSEKGATADGAGSRGDGGGGGADGQTRSGGGAGSARPGSAGRGADRLGARMEEETEVDILLARKRREANDRYFQRVNKGLLDVVAKLEEVSVAMRAVEQESKDIWGENESLLSSGAKS